jgi:hypothetical protein
MLIRLKRQERMLDLGDKVEFWSDIENGADDK